MSTLNGTMHHPPAAAAPPVVRLILSFDVEKYFRIETAGRNYQWYGSALRGCYEYPIRKRFLRCQSQLWA